MTAVECDVAVIGAGPAGLAAAIGAYDAGARRTVVIERDRHLGGILQQCIHNGFGLSLLGEDLTGPEYAGRYIAEAAGRNIRCLTDTMVLELHADRRMVAASPAEGLVRVEPRAAVLAMGCRERTRGAIAIPGTRPAGVMTAGAAQRLINVEGVLPGRRVVILGSGDIGMIMARRLHLEGCEVKAVVEYQSSVGGLARNLVQCIRDFDIPLHLGHTLCDIRGRKRVTGVEVCPAGPDGAPDPSRSFEIECDTLLLSVGLIPENELSRRAGVELDPRTGGPVVDERFQTSVPGVFAAGNVLQVYDLVDDVTRSAVAAGASAAAYAASGGGRAAPPTLPVRAGEGVRTVVPQRVSPGPEGVVFHLRSTFAGRRCTLELADDAGRLIFSGRYPVVRPAQMVRATVRNIETRSAGLTFNLRGVRIES